MSPTMLEGLIVIILLVVAWQIGVQLAPDLFRGLKQANDQLNESSQQIERTIQPSSNQEQLQDHSQESSNVRK